MNIDPEISKAAPGLVGAFIAMWRLQGMSIPQRLTSLACGVACSYWGTNTVVKLAPVMSEGLTGFVLGLFGMTLVSKVFELLDELKPLEMLRLFIQKREALTMTDLHTLLSDPYLQGACLAVLLLACVLAVLSRIFDDTLSQRAAMLVVALGATAELSSIWDVLRQAPEANMGTAFTRPSFGVLLCGVAFYAAATAWKIWRRWSLAGRPTHPLRRSTDWDSLSPLPPRDAPVPFPPTVPMDRDERPGRIERREKDAA